MSPADNFAPRRSSVPPDSGTAADGTLLLAAENLDLGYGSSLVLRGVNLSVRRGEHWFLLGPNGAGKSTFARAVLGLLTPKGGCLRREGGLGLSGSIGYVPQQSVPHPSLPMTLREFVALGFAGTRVSRTECNEAVRRALASVGLDGRERDDVGALSGGMRQRAMVARAVVRRPVLLVLDEPTSNLDPASQEAMLLVLARLRRDAGLTLLFISHDVPIAARYATHVAFFHDGVVESGSRDLLMQADVLRRVYGVDICVSLDASGHATLHLDSPEPVA
ncbi:MAG: metal ABC transporter ATP-binding protein [Candidatus Binatia bacterium]